MLSVDYLSSPTCLMVDNNDKEWEFARLVIDAIS